MKNILRIIISSLLIPSCATYQDFMADSNDSLEKYFLEYTMYADSVLITKYPAHTRELYVNYRKRLTITDTIFNYKVDVLSGNGYSMNYYFSNWENMDSCIINFKNYEGLQTYLNQYLDLTCSYQWLYIDSLTYIQTNSWAMKNSEIDSTTGEKQKLIGSRLIKMKYHDDNSMPTKLKISIPLIDADLWKNITQANNK